MKCGATIRSAFCGPCFGAGDVPCNNGLSIRHTTRNFPNREGSKPSDGQISWVALMDARSIAATALNGGILTAATDTDIEEKVADYHFDNSAYNARVYNGFGNPQTEKSLQLGPNIADWPKMSALTDNMLLYAASVINDSVTTTDELIPSGETSSYRSNPLRLAEYTLSRKDPDYVGRAKNVYAMEQDRLAYIENKDLQSMGNLSKAYDGVGKIEDLAYNTEIGSFVFAVKPGDGSAREQAASCQKVLGGLANVACAYATKRYRSNLINWGMLPFITEDVEKLNLAVGDRLFVRNIKDAIKNKIDHVDATVFRVSGNKDEVQLLINDLSDDERDIILAGCLINYYNI